MFKKIPRYFLLFEDEGKELKKFNFDLKKLKDYFKKSNISDEEKKIASEVLANIFSEQSKHIKDILETDIKGRVPNDPEDFINMFIDNSEGNLCEKKIIILIKYLVSEIYKDFEMELDTIKKQITEINKQLSELKHYKSDREELKQIHAKLEKLEHILIYGPVAILFGTGLIGLFIAIMKHIISL